MSGKLLSFPRLRGTGLVGIAVFLVTLVYVCFSPRGTREQPFSPGASQHGRCTDEDAIARAPSWEQMQAKFANLTDEKFTIVMQTYRRLDELTLTLNALLTTTIPSLHEVVVVWNDVDTKPPANYVSKLGIPVRYRASPRNSLNEKMKFDPDYKTRAVFLSDDDIYHEPSDLEFIFQAWRKFGQDRITGGIPRCVKETSPGQWGYDFGCSRKTGHDVYSIIITGLSFAHVGFLDYYSSDDATMTKLRNYVDDKFNCEDIGLNFAASLVTRTGPLLVRGYSSYYNMKPKKGISKKAGHSQARSQCVNDFVGMVGCLPLVDETAHIARGVVRNTWLQWLGDVLGVV